MEPKASEVPTEEAYRRGWIDGHSAAHKSERAAIVAWLRSESGDQDDFATYAAEAIERGDHLKDSHPTPDAV